MATLMFQMVQRMKQSAQLSSYPQQVSGIRNAHLVILRLVPMYLVLGLIIQMQQLLQVGRLGVIFTLELILHL